MKKFIAKICVIFICGFLIACNSEQSAKTFIGTIDEINGNNAVVNIEEGEILKSGHKANVDLSVAGDIKFHLGDRIKVGYDDGVRESHPLGINTVFVKLLQ